MPKIDVLDASLSRPMDGGPSFSSANRLNRALFRVVWFLAAAWTPSFMQRWRRLILVLFGATMGRRADVRGSAKVWLPSNLVMQDCTLIAEDVICYNQARITLERGAIVSQRSFLCTGSHDTSDAHFQLITKPVVIREGAWIAAEAFVGRGVVVGSHAVLGARGAAFEDLDERGVYIGNPALKIKVRKVAERRAATASSDHE